MEIEHWPSFLASRYLNPALSIGVPSKALLKYEMTDEMDGQPVASYITEGSAFDVEARMLREIEWRPPREWWELLPSRRDALLPQFYSETVASRIPIGLWDRILGYLANERETLGIVEEVCRGWYPTSNHLKEYCTEGHTCPGMEGVRLYARYIKTIPRPRRTETEVSLRGSVAEEGKQRSRGDNQRSLAHVGTFAAMFAGGHLPRLSALSILDGEWTPGAIPQSVFLHLSSFHSITSLELHDIILPSITVLLRLACAFDRLQELIIRYLRLLDTRVPPASRRWAPSPNLKKLTFTDLNWPDELRTLYVTAELETSGGSETVLFLLNAVSCSDLNQLLRYAGKALRRFGMNPLRSLSGANPHSIQPLRVSDVDLSRNVSLRKLNIGIDGDIPAALLERAETYGVIQRMISSTCPTVLENITVEVWRYSLAGGSSFMSHVLLALRRAICLPDHPLAPEKYTSLESVRLDFIEMDESSMKQMKAAWADLAPIWFPSLYSRGVINGW